ncbi:MAG TPA: MBL fold metallo-hydrolase, partial [bacterium]|nr:MBL fold metallo-hydrolase [bacterium]
IAAPELNVCFDIGKCPKDALAIDYVLLSHGHMDHSAGIAYYYSQRNFQGMGAGTVVCHPLIEKAIRGVMEAWVDLEAQRTPYNVIGLEADQEHEIKNHLFLRAFSTVHTVASLGFVVVEKRGKLRADLVGLPQEKLIELKSRGENITQVVEVPLVCYTGDTMWGPHFDRPDVLSAKILITECTFTEPGHRDRAMVGQHLHLDDVLRLLERSKAEAVVLTHLSRRTHMGEARKQIEETVKAEDRGRVYVLMDSRSTRRREEKAGAPEAGAGTGVKDAAHHNDTEDTKGEEKSGD